MCLFNLEKDLCGCYVVSMMTQSFMEIALRMAQEAARLGEVPVGAVIVDAAGRVLAQAHNRVEMDTDPTAHAEMMAIREVTRQRGQKFLEDCALYVTLEPCAMCAQAIAFARLRRLYYGAFDSKGGGVDHGARVFAQPTCHHKPEVYGGVMESASAALLKAFFESKR